MKVNSTDPPQQEFLEAWVHRATRYANAVEKLILAERSARVRARDYEAVVDVACAFDACERKYLALGCQRPDIADEPRFAGLLDVLDGARMIADAIPATTSKKHKALFRRVWCNLVAAVRERGGRR